MSEGPKEVEAPGGSQDAMECVKTRVAQVHLLMGEDAARAFEAGH